MASKYATLEECRKCHCLALRRASRAVTQHYESAFRGAGLRATQFTVLSALAVAGPLTVSRLARILGMERTTLTRNLRPLESKGWVEVAHDADDQRLRRVTLTPLGLATATGALPAWRKAQAQATPVLKRLGVSLTADHE